MKPREKGGVVDSRLNVYGVEGLKVAGALASFLTGLRKRETLLTTYIPLRPTLDMSIAPANVGAVSRTFPRDDLALNILIIIRTPTPPRLLSERRRRLSLRRSWGSKVYDHVAE